MSYTSISMQYGNLDVSLSMDTGLSDMHVNNSDLLIALDKFLRSVDLYDRVNINIQTTGSDLEYLLGEDETWDNDDSLWVHDDVVINTADYADDQFDLFTPGDEHSNITISLNTSY